MSFRNRVLAVLVAPALLGGTLVAPAAVASAAHSIPWQPYRSGPFHDDPGAVCSFGVQATTVVDREQYRTLATYSDGSPKLQEYRGPLYYRYTNQTSGKSVVRNLSGYAFFAFGKDGSQTGLFLEHGGTTVPVGNQGYPAGEWVFSGQFIVRRAADGTKHVQLLHAHAENLCRTLA